MAKKKKQLSKVDFLARMAAGRAAAAKKRGKRAGVKAAGKKNPPKFDRCVKAVKKRGGKVNAYAVCAPTRKNAAKKAPKKGKAKRRKNPEQEAAERYEFFHGAGAKGADVVTDVTQKIHEHGVLSGIGKLVSLRIKAIDGSGIVKLEKFGGALVAQDEKGTQLYIKGGNQAVTLKDFGITRPHENEILGGLVSMAYQTDKTHLRPEDGGEAEYTHVFGKNGSRLPLMVYDVRNKLLHVAGGGYDLPEVGIRG